MQDETCLQCTLQKLRVHSIGMIQIRVSDAWSPGPWYFKWIIKIPRWNCQFLWSMCYTLSDPSDLKSLILTHCLYYKHQWNTRWAFPWKHNILTCENNMLSSHVKRSPLLWLHNKSRLSQQKLFKWNGSVFHWCLYS